MTNESIRAAFERMWQHTIAKIDEITIEGATSWNDLEDRPFYEDENIKILPETEMVFDTDGFVASASIDFKENETYTVSYNGVEYTTTTSLQSYGGIMGVAFGNLAVLGGNDTGEPFLLGYLDSMSMMLLIPLDSPSEVRISITKPFDIKKLDNKFLNLDWLPVKTEVLIAKEKIVTFHATDDITDTYGGFPDLNETMVQEGQTIIVYFDGIRYELTAMHISEMGFVALHESHLMGDFETVPCYLIFRDNRTDIVGYSGEHTASVYKLAIALPEDAKQDLIKDVIEALPKWNGGAY